MNMSRLLMNAQEQTTVVERARRLIAADGRANTVVFAESLLIFDDGKVEHALPFATKSEVHDQIQAHYGNPRRGAPDWFDYHLITG